MAETDPFEWSTAEVVEFLQQNQFTILAQQWSDNALDGRMLLEDLDLSLLKKEFGIVGLKERMLIMQAIRTLRKSSAVYTEFLLPTLLPYTSLPPVPKPLDPPRSIEPIGTRIRKGEELVEDSDGRKRRRLNLETTLANTVNPSSLPEHSSVPSGFLHHSEHTVDEIFYGDTVYGAEIKHNETEDDECYDNFTIFGRSEFSGNASFVYRCLLRTFQQVDPRPITYHQNSAFALYPYSERLLEDKDARSVTIFEPSETGVKAIRERAQTLSFQQHEAVNAQMSPGKFSYLLDKYTGTDELLPTYGQSNYGSDSADEHEVNVEDLDSASEDDMAEEDSAVEASVLSHDLVHSLVEQTMDLQRQAWRHNQLLKLDKNNGRSVWRLAKGNMQKARALIQDARKRSRQLADRLSRLKMNLMDRTFENEQEVKQACLILEPTVHDTLYEEWKIKIWNLKVKPAAARQLKSSAKSHHGASTGVRDRKASDYDMQDFIVNDEDFENARESLSQNDHDSQPELRLQGPPSQLVPQNELTTSSEEIKNTAMMIDETLPDATEVPADFEYEISRAGSVESDPLEQFTEADQTSGSIQTPQKDKFTTGLPLEQDSPGLPSLETLFQSRPSTARKQATIIEITSSPVRPTLAHATTQPSPLKRFDVEQEQELHTKITYSENPDNDSFKQIRSWTYEDLEEKGDRRRMLLKLVSTVKDERFESLVRLLTGNMTTCFAKVRAAISATNEGSEVVDGYDEKDFEVMRDAARIYLGYLYIDHRFFESDMSEFASFGYEWPWDGDDENYAKDLNFWHKFTWDSLKRFKTRDRETIVIDSDDETHEVDRSGHSSTRKKTIKRDRSAARKRAKAAERAANYESQHQYSQTGSFVAGEDGVNEVPLYTPDDMDPSKHVYLNPAIAKRLKPHQVEGVKFMWREITAPEDEDGQGCLLAHTMGLGKTAQSLALLTAVAETAKDLEKRDALPDDLKRVKSKLRALILCPPTLMANWKREIATWCPEKLFHVFSLSSEVSDKALRLDELKSWRHLGGIMLCGYTMFTKLINRQGGKTQIFDETEHTLLTKILLEKPHIVVADEVHSIKNDSSKTSLAVHKINTQRRIGLTGSPMSNNTAEIFALIDWVAPKFFGSKVEFKAYYQEPIEAGTYVDSTTYEVRRSLKKLAVLKDIIAPKLNRADITVLKGSLKSKVEFVLTIPLTDQQKLGYETYVKEILRDRAGEEGTTITQVKLFGWLSILQLLCNHPVIFRRKLLEPMNNKQKKGKRNTLNATENEVPASSSTASPSTAGPLARDSDVPSSTAVATPGTACVHEGSPVIGEEVAYADAHITQYDINKAIVDALLEVVPEDDSIELSYKTLLVRKIMCLSIQAGDKVLIFSQSIPSLNFLDHMLSSIGARYGRIQGDIAQDKREKVLKLMADGKLDVLLISTRAGGLGLNIQQANRVIIFDFAFNPTWEEQAIGRAYRLGQTKPVFVYRFVAGGTFEFALYDKQLFKTGLSSRVVDKKNPMRNANKKPGDWLKAPFNVLQQDISAEAGKDEHVMDKIIASQRDQDEFIRSIKTMETLMGESKDEALTAEEMQEVENDVLEARKTRKLAGGPATLAPPPYGSGTTAAQPHAIGPPELPSSSPSARVVTRY